MDDLVRHLAKDLLPLKGDPAPRVSEAPVPGSARSLEIHGRIDMGKGLGDDGIERIDMVVADLGSEFITLTIRTRPSDDTAEAVREIFRSFRVERRPEGSS